MTTGDPATPPEARAGWSERLWAALLGSEGRPEVLRWVAFGRNIMLAVGAMTMALGVGLTAFSSLQMRGELEKSLAAKGRTIADAAALAAFVPLSLEDRQPLQDIVRQYATEPDLALLRITDAAGKTWAEHSRPQAGEGRLLALEASVHSARRGDAAKREVGRVVVHMATTRIAGRLRRLIATSLAFNGAFVALVLAAGFVIIRNLTLRMQELVSEAQLAGELRRSNLELERFASVASHDLQEPLRKIYAFAEILTEDYRGKLDEKADGHLHRIMDGVLRMRRLIDDLLAYSRAGSERSQPEPVVLQAAYEEALANLEAALGESRAQVACDPLPTVIAHRGAMVQLLQNLLGNALKFRGREEPRLRVSARRGDREWVLSVSDNGIGIDPKHFTRVFELFQRLHPRQAYPGTGIGLAVCRRIVERHGGRIWVESQPGKGTTFLFTIPEGRRQGAAQGGSS